MNTRCVPFLALVIWFLLVPPFIEPLPPGSPSYAAPRLPYLKPDAPLLAWLSRGAFPSHVQCDEALTSALHNTQQAVERYEAQLEHARRGLDEQEDSAIPQAVERYEAQLDDARRSSDEQEDSAIPELQYQVKFYRRLYQGTLLAKCVAADDPRLVEK